MISIFDTNHIIQAGGLLAITLIIFAECGLLIGLVLPGDTLLIPAGIWASHHHNQLNIWLLLPAVTLAAIVGYQVGYRIGLTAGPRFFRRSDGFLFRSDYIPRTQAFLNRHGGKAMILGRFVAGARTLIPVMAGIGKMSKRRFFVYNAIGSVIWSTSLLLGSYWIGQKVSNVDKWILPIVVAGLVATIGGEVWFVLRNSKSRKAFGKALREEFNWLFHRQR